MKIKVRQTRVPYTDEEKYKFFVEGKIKVPMSKNKKVYDKKQRRKNKIKISIIGDETCL